MNWKKFIKWLLYPHFALLVLLLIASGVALPYAMLCYPETHPLRIASYVLSAYTLTLLCLRIPRIVRFFRTVKAENRFVRRWLDDRHLRMNVTLMASLLYNGAYAALQLGLGIYHRSAWYYSLAAYYFLLALMRFVLAQHTLRYRPCEMMARERTYARVCGWSFLAMNVALSAMIFLMLYENRLVEHHPITTIAMAAYTFTSITLAIVNAIRYRKIGSPVFSASKAISLTSSCVSMLTLEGTMLVTFDKNEMSDTTRRLFMSLSGLAISVLIITMAVRMIARGDRKIEMEYENGKS